MSYLLLDNSLSTTSFDLILNKLFINSQKLVMLDFSVAALPGDIQKTIYRYVDKEAVSIVSTEEESPEAIDKFASSHQLRNTVSHNESIAIYMAKKYGYGIIAMEPAVIRLLKKLGFEILSVLPSDILIRGDTSFSSSSSGIHYWQQIACPQWTTSSTEDPLTASQSPIGGTIIAEGSDISPKVTVV